jgi:hypothetical protein
MDLYEYHEEIVQCINSHPKTDFVFFGCYVPNIDQKVKDNVRWAKPVNIMDFYIEFTKFNAGIQFVPLIDNKFNRIKSSIAWLDATLAGSVCLAPRFEEWESLPGITLYNDRVSFGNQLNSLLATSDFELKKMHDIAFEYIKDNLLLSKVNKLRMEVIESLTKGN